jgi:chromosome segregation ATPase
MENDNQTGAENEASNNSSQMDGNYPSQAEINSRLNNILFDEVPNGQTEDGEYDSNQPEAQQTDSESETNTETDTDGNEVHSQSEDEYEDVSRGVQKRIDKLTAKRKEAEEELAKLRKEVDELKQAAPSQRQSVVLPDVPHSDLNSVAEIEAEIAQARQVRDWAEANADGFNATDAEGNETHYDPAQIRQIKINAMKAIETTLPQRYQYIQTRDSIDNLVAKEYPWWKDKTSKERQVAEQFLDAFPHIRKFPDYKMVIGDYIRGVRAREQRGGQSNVPRAPIQPRSNSVAPSVKKQDIHRQDAYARFSKSGKTDDLSKLMEDYL